MKQESFGHVISMKNPMLGQDIYTYDSVGRVATHTDPKNNTTSFTRDGMGRITQVTYQDQSTKTYTYDCCRLNTVVDSVGTITFSYDTLKRLSSLIEKEGLLNVAA
jgi:YD repeat-containing protein